MMQVNVLHQEAMNLAELAQVAKLRGEIEQSNHLLRQAFTQESSAAALIANHWESEPTRSVLHRSAASLAIEWQKLPKNYKIYSFKLTSANICSVEAWLLMKNNYPVWLDNKKGTCSASAFFMNRQLYVNFSRLDLR